jgi:hypothetical protein
MTITQQYFNSPRKAKSSHYFRQESYEANHFDRTCVVTPVVQSSDKTDQNHSETTETLGFAGNMTPTEDTNMVESCVYIGVEFDTKQQT